MSRNGSGVYSLPAGNPVVTGTTISSSWANTTLSDIATALTGSVASDGQTAMTGNLQMGNNKVTGLAVATTSGDALSYAQAATVSDLAVTGNATVGGTLTLTGGLTLNGNVTVGDSSSDTLTVNATSTFAAGATFSSTFAANGGVTLGDASGDALTINSSAVSIPNSLNFDSNTFVIDATNNRVGIGTASPGANLEISGTATEVATRVTGTTGAVFTKYGNTGQNFWVGLDNSSGSGFVGSAYAANLYASGAYPIVFSTNSSERMRITSAGNVGIGTNNPSALLHVSDVSAKIRIGVDSSSQYTDIFRDNSTGYTVYNAAQAATFRGHIWQLGGSEAMRIDSSGNVGIGTSSPSYKLDAVSASDAILGSFTSTASANNTAIRFGISGNDAYINATGNSTANMAFRVYGTERMRLDSSGNLGLGVTPSAWSASYRALDTSLVGVFGGSTSAILSGNLYNNGTNWIRKNAQAGGLFYLGTDSSFTFYQTGSSTAGSTASLTQAMTLDASGNLAIGTTSAAGGSKLTVAINTTGATVPTDNLVAIVDTQDMALGDGGGIRFGGVFTTGGGTNADMGYIKAYKENATSGNYSYALTFGTRANGSNPAERMRIDSSGNLLVGTTSNIVTNDKFEVSYNGSVRSLAVNSSGNVYLYSLGTGTVYSNAGVLTSTNPSDSRLKDNITDISWGLAQVQQLRPVSYSWKDDQANQGTQYGFIAQEVQEVMPDLVKTFKGVDDVEYLGLEKDGIYATLVKAIQELKAEVDSLKAQLNK